MSAIVSVHAVPHTPSFIAETTANGERSETARFFSVMREKLEEAEPSVIVSITNDHFNTFFFDNWPTFAIGLAERTEGPNDHTPNMPWYSLAIDVEGARHLVRSLSSDGFDFSTSAKLQVDHGTLVPLHFMTPAMALPIIPLFVNCLVPPLPSSRRCYLLGCCIAQAIRRWPSDARVAVIASGSLSLEIGGPRAEIGKTFGVPDRDWAAWIVERVRSSEHEMLIDRATEERMFQAGNVAGELLIWIIALGIVGRRSPATLIEQPALGNAFACWAGQP